ncbi:MAG: cation transporter [Planctomycetes bacterium]|nr:cation transporter [Planctomycetota bacterium]
MGQQHHHPKPTESFRRGAVRGGQRRRLAWVLGLTGATMVGEIIGGLLTQSVALLSDAFHMLTHFGAIAFSYVAIVVALRPAAPEKTYRNWRFEVLATFLNGMLLVPIAGVIIYESIQRLRAPVPVKVEPMLAVAAVGLLVNLLSAAFLHRHSKQDMNIRGAFFHMVADSLSSVGVLAAGLLIWGLGERFIWADPAAAVLISLMILVWSVGLIRDSVRILLEAVPAHVDLEQVHAALRDEADVLDVHDLHIWTITSNMYALTAHVHLKRDLPVSETEGVGRRLRHMLDERFDINHATLQFEIHADESPRCEHDHAPHADSARP